MIDSVSNFNLNGSSTYNSIRLEVALKSATPRSFWGQVLLEEHVVLSATVKGQGYFLPIDVQYVDTRWDVPVFLPLHDSLSQELSLLCKLDSVVNLHLSIKFSHGSK